MRIPSRRRVSPLALVALAAAGIVVGGYARGAASRSSDAAAGETVQSVVAAIAGEPRPVGTPTHDAVRDYLVRELRGMGLEPRIERATAALERRRGPHAVATVHNVVARLRGSNPSGTVVLSAHYDSVPHSPGAADNGLGVAAVLEALRSVAAQRPPNDVLALFSDGHEIGLLGAAAFVRDDPEIAALKMVLNFDARGNGGAIYMFETSRPSRWLLRQLRAVGGRFRTNAILPLLYERLPNDTDFTAFKRAGVPGLNFASIDGVSAYHSALDVPERLDRRTVASYAADAAALARHFASLRFVEQPPEAVAYFQVDRWLVSFPARWLTWLLGVAWVAYVAIVAAALRRRRAAGRRIAIGAAACVAAIVLCGVVGIALMSGVYAGRPWLQSLTLGDSYRPEAYRFGFLAIAAAVTASVFAAAGRRASLDEIVLGTIGFWLALAFVVSYGVAPAASYPLVLPALAALTAAALHLLPGAEPRVRAVAIGCGLCACALAWLLVWPLVTALAIALGLRAYWLALMLWALPAGAMVLATWPVSRRAAVRLALVTAGVAVIAFALVLDTYAEGRPKPDSLLYVVDTTRERAAWVSTDRRPDGWTALALGDAPHRDGGSTPLGLRGRAALSSPAPFRSLPAPELVLLTDRVDGAVRLVHAGVRSPRGSGQITVAVDPADALMAAVLDDQRLPGGGSSPWVATHYTVAPDGVPLTLQVKPGRAFKVTLEDRTVGLPDSGLVARPSWAIVSPQSVWFQDTTVVSRSYDFASPPVAADRRR